jgi:hypothetical protein
MPGSSDVKINPKGATLAEVFPDMDMAGIAHIECNEVEPTSVKDGRKIVSGKKVRRNIVRVGVFDFEKKQLQR